jgi:hypothetical protein
MESSSLRNGLVKLRVALIRKTTCRLTAVATWQGFVYVAFVIDAFRAHRVGWRGRRTICSKSHANKPF